MTQIEVKITGSRAVARVLGGPLTSGMVGIPVRFSFDESWDELDKIAVYRAGDVIRSGGTDLAAGDTVPWEVMAKPCVDLYTGVEGRNADGTVVIPTVWAKCDYICAGADSGADPGLEPESPLWVQLKQDVEQLQKSGGGAVSQDMIDQSVQAYLQDNPVDVEIPDSLPNPHKLTFTGAVSGEYDGSEAVTIEIPEGGESQGGDYIPNPTTAEVGQTIVVKAVDDSGKPTEWECVDPEAENWDYEKIITLAEDAVSVTVNTFDDGTDLILKKIQVIAVTKNATSSNLVFKLNYDGYHSSTYKDFSSGTYAYADRWIYGYLQAEINKEGVLVSETLFNSNVARYGGYSQDMQASAVKTIHGVTNDAASTEIFPTKISKIKGIGVYASVGALIAGSNIRIRGVRV